VALLGLKGRLLDPEKWDRLRARPEWDQVEVQFRRRLHQLGRQALSCSSEEREVIEAQARMIFKLMESWRK
jgi:hypothetical protein